MTSDTIANFAPYGNSRAPAGLCIVPAPVSARVRRVRRTHRTLCARLDALAVPGGVAPYNSATYRRMLARMRADALALQCELDTLARDLSAIEGGAA